MKLNYKVNALVLILSSLILLTGCPSKPSEKDERQAIENILENDNNYYAKAYGKVLYKVLSIERLNSQSGTSNGVDFHKVQFRFTRECLYRKTGVCSREGDVQEETIWVTFEKTEKGWKGPDGNIY